MKFSAFYFYLNYFDINWIFYLYFLNPIVDEENCKIVDWSASKHCFIPGSITPSASLLHHPSWTDDFDELTIERNWTKPSPTVAVNMNLLTRSVLFKAEKICQIYRPSNEIFRFLFLSQLFRYKLNILPLFLKSNRWWGRHHPLRSGLSPEWKVLSRFRPHDSEDLRRPSP